MTSRDAMLDLRKDAINHLDHHTKYLNERLDAIEKDLEDFEWLKSKIGLLILESLPTHDKFELLRILGIDINEWENL